MDGLRFRDGEEEFCETVGVKAYFLKCIRIGRPWLKPVLQEVT